MGIYDHSVAEFDIISKSNPDSEILKLKDDILNLIFRFSESGQSGGSAPYTIHEIINEIKNVLNENIINEFHSNTDDSLSYEFNQEINKICHKIKTESIVFSDEITECIKKLLNYEPISPICGIDDEWFDVSEYNDNENPWYQNKRCHGLFKYGKEKKAYYLDAIVCRNQNKLYWSGAFWISKEDYETGDRNMMIGKKAFVKSFPFVPKTFFIDVIDIEFSENDFESFVKDVEQLEEIKKYYDLYN